MRSKLGFSVGLLGALVFFAAFFGGIIPTILVAGYILIFEENAWLKHVALKGTILLFFFYVINAIIGFIPDILSWISTLMNIFSVSFDYSIVTNIIRLFTQLLSIAEKCLFLILGLKALNLGTLSIPFVDKYIK